MKQVKLTRDVGVRKAGEVLDVDDASAAALVAREDAVDFDPAKDKADAERTAPMRGSVSAVAVVDADEPAAPAPVAKPAEDPAPAPEHPEPSMSDSLPELRARAVAAGKATEDEAKSLTKAQLVDKLTS